MAHNIDVEKLRTEIKKSKNNLLGLNTDLKKQKLIKQILQEIAVLYSNDILYGKNKKVVLDILDSIDLFEYPELQDRFKQLRDLVYKNVKKVVINN